MRALSRRWRRWPPHRELVGKSLEVVQGLGIGEGPFRGGLFKGYAGKDPFHRNLELLPAQRPGHRLHLMDGIRDVPRGQGGAQLARDRALERVVEHAALTQDDEE